MNPSASAHPTVPATGHTAERELDNALDQLDTLFDCFDGITVSGGVDAENSDDGCAGGACKI